MRRREFFCTVCMGASLATGGCLSTAGNGLGGNPSSGEETATPDSSGSATPTSSPPRRREADGLTAVVADITGAGTAVHGDAMAAAFDCEALTATLDGRLSTSSCRTVALDSLSVSDDGTSARLVVFPFWMMDRSPAELACAGATYEYRVRLEAAERLPETVTVVHEHAGDVPPKRFRLTKPC